MDKILELLLQQLSLTNIETNKKLYEVVLKQFSLTLDNFNKVCNQSLTEIVTVIKKVLSKHTLLKRLSYKQ